MPELTFAEVNALLKYDSETGKLFWRARPADMFPSGRSHKIWNTRYADKEAFTSHDGRGYRVGAIFDSKYKAHRVCWLLHNGKWPSGDVDHINGNKADNRAVNLRDASRAENMRNVGMRRNNTSGVAGVYWFARRGKWMASIKVDGVQRHLGYFDNIEDAAVARAAANQEFGFSERHGVSTQKAGAA